MVKISELLSKQQDTHADDAVNRYVNKRMKSKLDS